jgi:tRNA A-37 threonylcarbamoyl transferase component Bud32
LTLLNQDNGRPGGMQVRLRALALIEPSHGITDSDTYFARRILSRRAVAWTLSIDVAAGAQISASEQQFGCICVSAGAIPAHVHGSSVGWALVAVMTSVFGVFAARCGEASGVSKCTTWDDQQNVLFVNNGRCHNTQSRRMRLAKQPTTATTTTNEKKKPKKTTTTTKWYHLLPFFKQQQLQQNPVTTHHHNHHHHRNTPNEKYYIVVGCGLCHRPMKRKHSSSHRCFDWSRIQHHFHDHYVATARTCSWCQVQYCSSCCEENNTQLSDKSRGSALAGVCKLCLILPCLVDPRRHYNDQRTTTTTMLSKNCLVVTNTAASPYQTKQQQKIKPHVKRYNNTTEVSPPPSPQPQEQQHQTHPHHHSYSKFHDCSVVPYADDHTNHDFYRCSIFFHPDLHTNDQEAGAFASLADFEIIKFIGRGACGRVKLVRKKCGIDEGSFYAMKSIKKRLIVDRGLVEATLAERHILDHVEHPFIASLRYAFQTDVKLYLLSPYYPGGNLLDQLRLVRVFTEDRARLYAAEVALALAHLHGQGIMYRDLKLENVLCDGQGHIALTDFGMSKLNIKGNESTGTFVGTYQMMAPDMLTNQPYTVQHIFDDI